MTFFPTAINLTNLTLQSLFNKQTPLRHAAFQTGQLGFSGKMQDRDPSFA
jgi:hypothetical protein